MRPAMERIWVRALALILFCLFTAAALVFFWVYSFALEDGWYSKSETGLTFASSGMCRAYIDGCLNYVSSNIQWLRDPTSTSLGTYGGAAFSYTVTDAATGEITADTRTEKSQYVTETDLGIYWTEGVDDSYREYTVAGYVNLPVEPYEGCYREFYIFELLFPLRGLFLPGLIICSLLTVGLLIFSIGAAVAVGKSGVSTLSGRIPFDAAVVVLWLVITLGEPLLYRMMDQRVLDMIIELAIYEYRIQHIFQLWYLAALAVILANQLAGGTLRDRLLLYRLASRMTTGMLTGVLCGLHILLLVVGLMLFVGGLFHYDAVITWLLVMFLFDAVTMPFLIRWTVEAKRIRKASNALAAGDLNYKVDTDHLHAVWKELGGDLNSIGEGMTAAVEKQMRSERMKTELITNVSHDLKTPLTSIINYVSLLKQDDLPPETQREYLDVLDRQSDKLKKLTEDVIEASKAASGVMTVNAEMVDVGELVEQSVGEYAERLQAVGVEPVIHAPQGETRIWADGRLLGRVLDNFITNIIKYAQSGTRAYFDVTVGEQGTVIEVKNTSRAPLDIPADELMERFVRGDSSRGTEGSGLGLSIARSLTELMGGKLELILDGDLFKAQVTFPSAVTPPVLPTKTDP